MTKQLFLSQTDKKICGVCGGIGEYCNVDSTVIRLAWVLLSVFTVMIGGVLAYLLACIIIPERS